MKTNIQLLPLEVRSEDFFTPEQHDKFREDWQRDVVPQLDEHARAHARSVEDSFRRPPLKLAA
jgi:hypothetical protein